VDGIDRVVGLLRGFGDVVEHGLVEQSRFVGALDHDRIFVVLEQRRHRAHQIAFGYGRDGSGGGDGPLALVRTTFRAQWFRTIQVVELGFAGVADVLVPEPGVLGAGRFEAFDAARALLGARLILLGLVAGLLLAGALRSLFCR